MAAGLWLVLWHGPGPSGGWGCAGEGASEWEPMYATAGVCWWASGVALVLGEMVRGSGGYCSDGASREASSCWGKGLCLFVSVRSVIEYTPLKVTKTKAARLCQCPRARLQRERGHGPRGGRSAAGGLRLADCSGGPYESTLRFA